MVSGFYSSSNVCHLNTWLRWNVHIIMRLQTYPTSELSGDSYHQRIYRRNWITEFSKKILVWFTSLTWGSDPVSLCYRGLLISFWLLFFSGSHWDMFGFWLFTTNSWVIWYRKYFAPVYLSDSLCLLKLPGQFGEVCTKVLKFPAKCWTYCNFENADFLGSTYFMHSTWDSINVSVH